MFGQHEQSEAVRSARNRQSNLRISIKSCENVVQVQPKRNDIVFAQHCACAISWVTRSENALPMFG